MNNGDKLLRTLNLLGPEASSLFLNRLSDSERRALGEAMDREADRKLAAYGSERKPRWARTSK